MSNLWQLLHYQFIQYALIVGLALAILTSLLGQISNIRQSYFFAEVIAHSALAGVALGLWWATNPLFTAFVYTTLTSLLLYYLSKKQAVQLDNILGIVMAFSLGLAVLVFHQLPGYQPQLMSYLFGNILAISTTELWLVILVLLVTVVTVPYWFEKMSLLALDRSYAQLIKLPTLLLDVIYFSLLSLVTLLGVKLLGIILLNALYLVPTTTANLLAKSFKQAVVISIAIATTLILSGIGLSAIWNLPPGALTAVLAGLLFLLTMFMKKS